MSTLNPPQKAAPWRRRPVRRVELPAQDLNKVFPDHWSFLLGEIALYSFIVLLLSGTYLTLFFDPSQTETVYHGSYAPLEGVPMSLAYASTIASVVRRARRPGLPSDPPLGGAAVRRVDHHSPDAGVLHRRFPQAA